MREFFDSKKRKEFSFKNSVKNSLIFIILGLFLAGCSPLKSVENLSKNIDVLSKRTESVYKQLLKKYPKNNEIRLSFAKFYYKRRNYQKAQEILEKVKSLQAKLLLAKIYAHLGDYTSSLELFERAKNIEDGEALYLYGLSLEKKNLFSQAKKIYKKIKVGPYLNLAKSRLDSLKFKFQEKIPSSLEKLINNSPTIKDFPNASSVILFYKEKATITKDNKEIYSIHALIKVLNDKGREDWGEVEIGYDSTYEKVELDFARTVTADKKIISVGKENIRDVSKYLNFPLYSNARAFIISMPEVLKGSFIEYKVKIYKSKLINKKDFSFIYRLKESQPIIDCEFSLSVPKERRVFFKVLNKEYIPSHISFKPKESIKNGFRNFTFKFKNIPQLIPESNMVPSSFINPALVVSSFSKWEDFYNWWKGLYEDRLILNKEMRDFLNNLIKDSDSDYQKAKKIYEFCAEKIRYVAVEYGEAGFKPHKASEVFINKYGDCKDQAILLVSLLRKAGLKAYPVLIPTLEAYNLEEDLAASYFNHAIACVKIDKNLIFMDPTSSTTSFSDLPPSDQKRRVLVFFDKDYKILETPLIKDSLLSIKMDINIDDKENSKIQREVSSWGSYASSQRYYLKYTPPQLIEDNLQEKMKKFSSLSKLVDFKIENIDDLEKRPILKYNFLAYNLLSKVQDLRILPVLGEELVDTSWINRSRRNYPLYLGSPYRIEIQVNIHLPSNLGFQYLPQNLKIQSKWLDFNLTYKVENNNLLFKETLLTKQELVGESEYQQFKKIIEDILYSLKQQIILRKKDNNEA